MIFIRRNTLAGLPPYAGLTFLTSVLMPVVDIWDIPDIANTSSRCFNYRELHEHLSEPGTLEVGALSWDFHVERLDRVYDELPEPTIPPWSSFAPDAKILRTLAPRADEGARKDSQVQDEQSHV